MIRVLAIADRLTLGGIELMLLNTMPRLLDNGIRMDVCSQGGEGDLDDEFRAFGCTIHRVAKSLNPYSVAWELRRLLKEKPYEVVHSHKGYGSGGFALGADHHRIPIVVSIHSEQSNVRRSWEKNFVLRQARNAWLMWHQRKLRSYVDVFVGHSKVSINAFERRWREEPKRFRVIQNGIAFPRHPQKRSEARKDLGLDASDLVLLHVGNFRAEKNHFGLLEIARRVFEKKGDGILLMVGDGKLRNRIEAEVHTLGLDGQVRFEGLQRHVWSYFTAADVFVFPSMTEGFGNALVEAQGAGLPVVASKIPAHLEAVAPAQHRFLYSQHDIEAAANLILEQYEAALSESNGWVDSSAVFVRNHFTVERMADQLASLYAELAFSNQVVTEVQARPKSTH
jgi:glycosyltransferase EpsF